VNSFSKDRNIKDLKNTACWS